MKIYISNLDFSITNSDLNTLFAEYGEVTSANVITDRISGRSRGFGFVEMFDTAASQQAIHSLNETQFHGKTINVSEARPPKDKPSGFNGDSNRDNGRGYKSQSRDRRY
jgi:RNA recognition motif-containing protein